MKFRLEYKESKGQWHYDNGTHAENTNGWATVAEDEEDAKLRGFTDFMDKEFNKQLYPAKNNLSLSEVKKYWKLYSSMIYFFQLHQEHSTPDAR